MIDIPRFAPLRITQRQGRPRREDFDSSDHVLVIAPRGRSRESGSVPLRAQLRRLIAAARREPLEHASTRIDNDKSTTLTAALAPREPSTFAQLTWARKLVALTSSRGGRVAILVLDDDADAHQRIVEALLSALAAASFLLPSFKSGRNAKRLRSAIVFDPPETLDVRRISAEATGNNIARWLTALPPNILDAAAYRSFLETTAAEHGLELEFFNEKKLASLGAGAFLAVCSGNATRDAGIAKLSYKHAAPEGRIALVGKGIIFDTGGNNLKPFRNMLEMHADMQGSAVAAGLLVTLALLGVPYDVEVWLAITENRLSAHAYKSQDVVTATNGTTIQVIHTDAEGRMVLADTLALAARSNPDLIIDYATLTGACVTALTSRYSGVFGNRASLLESCVAAGTDSGERVWPFPMDADFDDDLKSDIADIKQCSPDGAGDHILAARFLQRFVPDEIPWLHVDLAAGRNKGGLAHIPTVYTGFGVRFTLRLLENELQLSDGFVRLSQE